MFTQNHKKPRTRICKSMMIFSLFIFVILIIIFSTNPYSETTQMLLPNVHLNYFKTTHNSLYPYSETTPTNVSHIVFGIAGLGKTWKAKKHYVESWWQQNITRGFLFLDEAPINYLPWPSTSPPVCVSSGTTDQKGVPNLKRIARVIKELYSSENKGVRWYVMGDDDTVFFLENLVEVLKKYDHNGYYYIGINSESIISNDLYTYRMGYGGAGFALSYPLAELLSKNIDGCLKKYQDIEASDQIVQSCLSDLGVSVTHEKGFHQFDLHGDISGLLSALPQNQLVSLHHLDAVQPIFPTMDRFQSFHHLMKAAKIDQSRLLQQSICYDHAKNWSISLSWGYSVHIYENYIPPSLLQLPLQTFIPWTKGASPAFMMNTRLLTDNPCDTPHFFYFDSVEETGGGGKRWQVVTSYVRRVPRRLPPCVANGTNSPVYSADYVEKILVVSPMKRLQTEGARRECCDFIQDDNVNVTTITLRPCLKYEITE